MPEPRANPYYDCISRKDAAKVLTKARLSGDNRPMIEILCAVSSVQPERLRAEWSYEDGVFRCSNCDCDAPKDVYGNSELTNYCPNCGCYNRRAYEGGLGMKYPKPVMKLSELKEMGWPETDLLLIFKTRTDLKIAWRGGNGKPNSPILFDTEALEKLRRAQCTGE